MRSSAVRLVSAAMVGTLQRGNPHRHHTLRVSGASRCSSPLCSIRCSAGFAATPTLRVQLRRYFATSQSLRQSWGAERVRPWMCIKKECRTVNKATAQECEACSTKKPVLGRWKCVDCHSVNFAGVKQCKKCKAAFDKSKGYWMCADCEENNRVDEIEGNSVCGFCGYDMAPRTAQQEEALRRRQEKIAMMQQQQEHFDSIPYADADEQFSDPLEGAENLDPSLRKPAASSQDVRGSSRTLVIPKIAPFVPPAGPVPTRHSRLHRSKRESAAHTAVRNAEAAPAGPPGFDWMCRDATCGHINPGDEETCLKCGAHIQPAEWECLLCAAMNHQSRSRCFHCHTAIPVCWTCQSCGTTTSVYDRQCRSCGVERPATEPKRASEVSEAGARVRGGMTPQRNEKRGDWYCPSCNRLNFSRRTECFQCSRPRPAETAAAAAADDAFAATGWGDGAATLSRQPAAMHNNWICEHCQASNFRTRHDCWKCGRASEIQGEWSPETHAPHFEHEGFQAGSEGVAADTSTSSAWGSQRDMWTCAKCYSKNFGNRRECFRCGANKTTVMSPRASKARQPVKL